MRIGRRALTLGLAAGLAARRARAADDPLEIRTLRLDREVTLALPRDPSAAAPLVVLLHGLGETGDEHAGARAWIDRYGLVSSVRRLTHPPLALLASRDDWGGALATMNDALSSRPYRGLAFACPHVPRMPADQLEGYARWIEGTLLPAVRSEAGARVDASPARIGGCSYGAWVSLEVFLRAPAAFGAWAGVQTAISRASAGAYADRLARVLPARPLLVETSTRDPYHDPSLALADALRARRVASDLVVLPGPHDQPWLRESGTPSLLAWLDRV